MSVPQRGAFGLQGNGSSSGRRGQSRGDVPPIPDVLNGAVFGNMSVPGRVIAGRAFEINGVVGLDCPHCVTPREVRVKLAASHLADDRIENVGLLSGRGQSSQFNFQVPAPEVPDQTVTIRLKAQRKPPVGSWETDNTAGPFEIRVVSAVSDVTATISEYTPWAVGGGAVGVGGARFMERSMVGGGVAGVGAGIGSKLLVDQLSQDGDFFTFPTGPVLASAALLGTGAILISQLQSANPLS